MAGRRFENSNCAVARALSEVGDWWSLRIVLQAMHGTRRYVDFQRELGIARNILGSRLERLVANGILRKVDVGEHGCRYEYRLSDKGRDLFVVVEALRQWGERWTGSAQPGSSVRDRASGRPVALLQVLDADGKPLSVRDVILTSDNGDSAA